MCSDLIQVIYVGSCHRGHGGDRSRITEAFIYKKKKRGPKLNDYFGVGAEYDITTNWRFFLYIYIYIGSTNESKHNERYRSIIPTLHIISMCMIANLFLFQKIRVKFFFLYINILIATSCRNLRPITTLLIISTP